MLGCSLVLGSQGTGNCDLRHYLHWYFALNMLTSSTISVYNLGVLHKSALFKHHNYYDHMYTFIYYFIIKTNNDGTYFGLSKYKCLGAGVWPVQTCLFLLVCFLLRRDGYRPKKTLFPINLNKEE